MDWRREGRVGMVVFTTSLPGTAWAASREVDLLLNKLVGKGILTEADAHEVLREIAASLSSSGGDAAFDAFTESDFGGGGTNHKGNVWYVKLATLTHSTLQVKYFDTEEVTGAKDHFDTLQVDWTTKF